MEKKVYIAKTLFGLENVLAQEIEEIGGENIEVLNRAVKFKASQKVFYKANMWLRTAISLLLPIKNFPARNEDELYREIKKIRWEDYFTVDQTFSITGTVSNSRISHSKYAALKTKDAIVDRFREKYRKRPSVEKYTPDLKVNLHIYKDQATLSLDSSGEPLSRRGYRADSIHVAPLNEVLAAGMILMTGWKGETPLIDPFCGSGTIPIEAAMIAHGIPPNLVRTNYCFMNWNDFSEEIWEEVQDEADDIKLKKGVEIFGFDLSERNVRQAVKNSMNSVVPAGLIQFEARDFSHGWKPEKSGTIITNPPYGERIDRHDVIELYSMIGDRLKQDFEGFNAWILTSSVLGMKNVGLRTARKIHLLNGALECKFLKYEMYRGTKKNKS